MHRDGPAETQGAAIPGPGAPAPEAEVLRFLAPRLREALVPLVPRRPDEAWLEVRIRAGRPVHVVTPTGDRWVGADGPRRDPAGAPPCEPEDLERTLQLVTRASLYAWEDELAQGFCTLPGGHRVGVAGRAVLQRGVVRSQKEFGALCFRVARAVRGIADRVLAACAGPGGLRAVLIFGPPGCGKTTLLRDLVRQMSEGRPDLGVSPRRLVVVDERSELAACSAGRPQFDVGPRTDVLDGCPKALGLGMAVRALAPEVLACDEVGGAEDAAALADAARCGVAVLATAHGEDLEALRRRPALRGVLRTGAFHLAAAVGRDRRVHSLVALTPAARGLPGVEAPAACGWAGRIVPADGRRGAPAARPVPRRVGGWVRRAPR